MRIAIDKNSMDVIEPKNEYIYLFDDEPLDQLIKTGLHCIYYKECTYVDVNLTNYNIDCFKQADKTEDYTVMPPKHDYKFAIIIPNCNNDRGSYQGKTYLRACIDSVMTQSYKNFELILVDDCSTDTSVETMRSYQDNRIHVIQNKRKRYNGGSRNVGIDYALDNLDFDYFCFLDSDDWWKHDKVLERINNKLYNHEMLTIGCEMVYETQTGYTNYNRAECYEDLWCFNNKMWCTAWARVIRKDKIAYFPEGSLMEDRTWTYAIADGLQFENVTNLKEVCYCWNRMNTENSVSIVRNKIWEASAWKHVGQQLILIEHLKHKEMIPIIRDRIDECIRKLNSGIYQQY